MLPQGNGKVGRNDPCPCGSGKKYKRCCLDHQSAAEHFWAQQREAVYQLTQDMLNFAEEKFSDEFVDAWDDFNMTDLSEPFDKYPDEQQIFHPYFLFYWDPHRPRSGKGASRKGGVVTRWYELENAGALSEMDRLVLEQATGQPTSFFEVLWSRAGEGIGLRDILIGGETEVVERSASRMVHTGDILYGQIWNLQSLSILGATAPIVIPPSWKGQVVGLRKKLRKKIAKQNRELTSDDLMRYQDAIRLAYLTIRDRLYTPPQFANTDGDPLVLHTLKFRIESPEKALGALASLAFGQSKEDILRGANFGKDGALRRVDFDWRKSGNRKIPSWENTILGNIKIAGRSLTAQVNSENRAKRLRAEIEKRLGTSAAHESTTAQTADELLAKAPNRTKAEAEEHARLERAILSDPEARNQLQQMIQKQTEDWVHQKVPALGGRTPLEAVLDPDGREIVESLLLDWERNAIGGLYQAGIRPDFNAVRRLLNLTSAAS